MEIFEWNHILSVYLICFSSPTEESETAKPRKMAIPDEVKARLGEPVVIEGKDPHEIKDLLKTLYER